MINLNLDDIYNYEACNIYIIIYSRYSFVLKLNKEDFNFHTGEKLCPLWVNTCSPEEENTHLKSDHHP